MKNIVFRVDASAVIGYGHIARCISLAEYCKSKSVDCVFVLRASDEKIPALLRQKELRCIVISEESDIYAINTEQTVKILILDVHTPALFPTEDAYHTYISALKENGFKVAAFEEMQDNVFPSDLVIIPYIGAEKMGYADNSSTKYLLGPQYFIFRQEFLDASRIQVKDSVRNIFICMGGSDPDLLTEKVLSYLVTYPAVYKLSIVFAQLSEERRAGIENILQGYAGTYQLLTAPPSVSAAMLDSDIGINNSGLIKYETSMIGLPCITMSNPPEHEHLMNLFAEQQTILHLGIARKVSESIFHDALTRLSNDCNMRRRMSANGVSLFDGHGAERIYENLLQLKN